MNYFYKVCNFIVGKIWSFNLHKETEKFCNNISNSRLRHEPRHEPRHELRHEPGVHRVSRQRKKTIPKTIRNQVWRKHCGNMLDGKCFCCHQNIAYECWEAGHIIAESKGGKTTTDNLRPLCIPCNRSMGQMNMFDFMNKYGFSSMDNLK